MEETSKVRGASIDSGRFAWIHAASSSAVTASSRASTRLTGLTAASFMGRGHVVPAQAGTQGPR